MADKKFPFEIRTKEGAYVAGRDTKALADTDCADRNKRAEAMDLVVRYKVVEA